jgi:hypothetical protein
VGCSNASTGSETTSEADVDTSESFVLGSDLFLRRGPVRRGPEGMGMYVGGECDEAETSEAGGDNTGAVVTITSPTVGHDGKNADSRGLSVANKINVDIRIK